MAVCQGALSAGLLEAYMARFELSKDQVLEQKKAFDVIDSDGNGKITFQEVKDMNAMLEQPLSDQELTEQFTSLDVDGNNTVTFPEFLKVYVKGEFGRDVPLPSVDETIQVLDLAPSRVRTHSCTLDPIDESKMVMKLSQKSSASYYLRVAKQMLAASEETPSVLELNALGYAIPHASFVASALQEENLAKVLSIRTSLREAVASLCAHLGISKCPQPGSKH
ncbi:unnamed protein product [Effrenium voratum]|nr:unnamed protein product [Effrenium voratum]